MLARRQWSDNRAQNHERAILAGIYHPFIVTMFRTYRTENDVLMLLEYIPGGELFTYLRKAERFENDVARHYAAEILVALEYLHSLGIVYRDLKPENLLLDAEGHIKITDFGFAKEVPDKTFTICGTPDYLAPEIIKCTGHSAAVDWWALGVLIYEMLAGYPPYWGDSDLEVYRKVLAGGVYAPLGHVRRLLLTLAPLRRPQVPLTL